MKQIELLWTGGWDSTFRICQLSRMPDTVVQPFYIQFPDRISTHLEINAITEIQNMLIKKEETKAVLLPVKIIKLEDIVISDKISTAFKRLRDRFQNLGSQYEILAAFAEFHPQIELGEEHYYKQPGTLSQVLIAGGLKFNSNNIGYIPVDCSDSDIKLIFGNYTFPIATLKEVDMLALVKTWQYEDIMRHIWFCQHPIKNKPCGVCYPCCIKMHSGMEFLLSESAQCNYQKLKKIDPSLINDFKHYVWTKFKPELSIIAILKKITTPKGLLELEKSEKKILDIIYSFENC